jgi:hypothetical protein
VMVGVVTAAAASVAGGWVAAGTEAVVAAAAARVAASWGVGKAAVGGVAPAERAAQAGMGECWAPAESWGR